MKNHLAENIDYLARQAGIKETLNKKTGQIGIAQEAVEELTGVAQTTLSGIFTQGKTPRLSTLEKIAGGFGVEVWQLLAPTHILRSSLDDYAATLMEYYYSVGPDEKVKILDIARLYASQSVRSDD